MQNLNACKCICQDGGLQSPGEVRCLLWSEVEPDLPGSPYPGPELAVYTCEHHCLRKPELKILWKGLEPVTPTAPDETPRNIFQGRPPQVLPQAPTEENPN